jgi:hypothetical protein
MKQLWIALALLPLVAGCNASADTKSAEEGVASFHQSLDGGRFDQIYTDTGAEFKSVTAREDFTKLLTAIHAKLGNFRRGKTVGWNDNVSTGGHFVTLRREAQFDRGAAQEEFVFNIASGKTAMVGYHISSNALITG